MSLPDENPIILIEQGRAIVDYSRLVANWLRDVNAGGEWRSTFTDNSAPQVQLNAQALGVDVQGRDTILVYAHPETAKPVTAPYLWRNRKTTVSCDMRTSVGRSHMYKMQAEVERIASVHRGDTFGVPGETNLSGRSWVSDIRIAFADEDNFGTWRMVIDIDLNWDFAAVYTS